MALKVLGLIKLRGPIMAVYLPWIMLICTSWTTVTYAHDPVTKADLIVMHSQFRPYIYKTNNNLEGFLAKHLERVFAASNIHVHWENVEWSKQLNILERDAPNVCVSIIFKTREREAYIKYSDKTGQDSPYVLVAKANRTDILRHKTLKSLALDQSLLALKQSSTSDGEYIDTILKNSARKTLSVSWDRIARSIDLGTGDYFMVSKLVAETILKEDDLENSLQIYTHLSDIQSPLPYYLGCSKSTDPELINRFNATLNELGIAQPNFE